MFEQSVPIPARVTEFEDTGDDVLHIAGMIILAFEARYERNENIHLYEPETHLHPAQNQKLCSMLGKLLPGTFKMQSISK